MIKQILGLLFCFLVNFALTSASEEISYTQTLTEANPIQHADNVMRWAEYRLPHSGILTEKSDGFVYVKVDDRYIDSLLPILANDAYTKPPYFRREDSPGAHISVFYVDEREQTGVIKEIGQRYSFRIDGLAVVPKKTQEYIVLQIISPELEQLRQKYGLSPLINGHDFHITIAQKKQGYHQ